jgi:hypothetical protein
VPAAPILTVLFHLNLDRRLDRTTVSRISLVSHVSGSLARLHQFLVCHRLDALPEIFNGESYFGNHVHLRFPFASAFPVRLHLVAIPTKLELFSSIVRFSANCSNILLVFLDERLEGLDDDRQEAQGGMGLQHAC